MAKEYPKKFTNPYFTAEKGRIDLVIDPIETRIMIVKALSVLQNKRESRPARKHGNINL
ncbi:MAG: carboxyl transferase domain-containing protein [Nitrososphaeraceae archaeon]|nr:carboxyl transferase domain-containing protein [Nitrososphaeraceae archaeon]